MQSQEKSENSAEDEECPAERTRMKKEKSKPKILKDKRGEYIKQWYFINGKQKLMKINVIDGIPVYECYEQNADPITLLENGNYELLHELGY